MKFAAVAMEYYMETVKVFQIFFWFWKFISLLANKCSSICGQNSICLGPVNSVFPNKTCACQQGFADNSTICSSFIIIITHYVSFLHFELFPWDRTIYVCCEWFWMQQHIHVSKRRSWLHVQLYRCNRFIEYEKLNQLSFHQQLRNKQWRMWQFTSPCMQ